MSINRVKFHVQRGESALIIQWRSYRGAGPPCSILALKKHTFPCVALNTKSFFWTKILLFEILVPPLEGFTPWKFS